MCFSYFICSNAEIFFKLRKYSDGGFSRLFEMGQQVQRKHTEINEDHIYISLCFLSALLSYVRILLEQATNNVIIFNKARNAQQLNDILFCTEI